jgi:hypothetical protein
MLEEWRSGDGIEVLDGWTFQVYLLYTDLIPDLIYSVFSSHRSQYAYSRKGQMSNIDFYYQITRLF